MCGHEIIGITATAGAIEVSGFTTTFVATWTSGLTIMCIVETLSMVTIGVTGGITTCGSTRIIGTDGQSTVVAGIANRSGSWGCGRSGRCGGSGADSRPRRGSGRGGGRRWRLGRLRLRRGNVQNGRAESGRDADHGNGEKCYGDDDGLFELHGDAPFPFENAIQALFGLPGAGHGDALPPNAAGRGFERGEKSENCLGVTCAVGAGGERGVVTGFFGEFCEAAIEPPS